MTLKGIVREGQAYQSPLSVVMCRTIELRGAL